jgi:methyl coenzyme M reductase beta subunit
MRLRDDARIAEQDDTVVREVNGEAVLLHLVSERYYVLDEPTTRMWRVLVESSTFADAVRALGDEFDVEVDVLRRDLERFVGELVDEGLVSVGGAG